MIKACCDPYQKNNRYNFGDILSLDLIRLLTGRKVKRIPLQNVMESDIVCAGSILEYIPENYRGYIWGTGFMFDINNDPGYEEERFSLTKNFKKAEALAVRGELTKSRINQKDIELGDPGILSCLLKSKDIKVKYEVGVVPHYVDQENVKELADKNGWFFINVLDSAKNVINNIAKCKNIISSSLHGVIAGESLGIPTVWQEFSTNVGGAGFKFRDYYSAGNTEETRRKLIEVLPFKK